MTSFLLDTPFPVGTTVRGTATVRLERWAGSDHRGDSEFVQAASESGFDGVVFMGREYLASRLLLEAARKAQIALVVTHSDEPVSAQDALVGRLDEVAARAGPGWVLLVLSSEVRRWRTGELLEQLERESEKAR